LRVSGAIVDKVGVAEFSAGQKPEGPNGTFVKRGFFEHGPVDFVVRVKNEGSVHERVQGTIEVTNIFGKKVGSVKVNDKGGNVLPDSIRKFEQQLSSKRLFGLYTAKLNLSYLNGGKKLNASVGFWVIPWKLLLLGLVALVALAYVLKIGIKRYNEHIITQARRRR
jgi:hypothetical protein